jgi:Domain of unknown function (DUF1707)
MGNPKPNRSDPAFLLALIVVVTALGVGAGLMAVTQVTVPLLWPMVATLSTLWLGAREIDYRIQNRRSVIEQAAQHPAEPRPTVRAILHDYHRTGVRIGDAERDVFVRALHDHYAAGRLEQAELEERLNAAVAARTVDELAHAVRELPDERTGR